MAKTNVYMNWKEVAANVGGTPTTIGEVTEVRVMDTDQLEQWQADGHKFPTVTVAASGQRGVTVSGGDAYKLRTLPKGTPFVFTAKLYDAYNGAGEGCILLALNGAVVQDASFGGASNKFAAGSVVLLGTSADGTTDPLVITQQGTGS